MSKVDFFNYLMLVAIVVSLAAVARYEGRARKSLEHRIVALEELVVKITKLLEETPMAEPQAIINLNNKLNDGWPAYLAEEATPQIDLGFTRLVIRLVAQFAGSEGSLFRADDYSVRDWRQMAADLRPWKRKHRNVQLGLYIGRLYSDENDDALEVAGEVRHAHGASIPERTYPVIRGGLSIWDNESPEKFIQRNEGRFARDDEHLGEVSIEAQHKFKTPGTPPAGLPREDARRLISEGKTPRIFNQIWLKDIDYWKH
jgi:hypothetical protein